MGLDDISIRHLRPLSIRLAADISPVYYVGNGFFGWWTGLAEKSACCDVDDIFTV
jgi:hypothetical protein